MRRLLLLLSFVLMGSSLPTLKYRALDSAGNPMSGAKLYFYTHGTTTPKNTYSNEALTVANSNPVVADANGWFAEIYLNFDDAYKVVLKSSAGVVQWTVDNINATSLAGTLNVRMRQVASNPLDYGAVGDGVADESSYVQSAITNATGVVDLLGKTYRCDTTLTMKSDVVLKNGTLNFSNSASNIFISVAGTINTAVTLNGNVAAGATTITPTAVTGLAEDDWIFVESGDSWAGGTATYGEVYQITAVGGGVVTLDRPTVSSYTALTAPGLQEINVVKRVGFEDLTIVASTAAAGTGTVFSVKYASEIRFKDVRIDGAKQAGVLTNWASDVVIDGLVMTGGGTGSHGLYVRDASRDIVLKNSSFTSMYRVLSADADTSGNDGISTNIIIQNNVASRCTEPVYVGRELWGLVLAENFFEDSDSGSATGIYAETAKIEIRNNEFYSFGTYPIAIYPNPPNFGARDWVVISENRIEDCATGIWYNDIATPLSAVDSLIIERNSLSLTGGAGYGIQVEPSANTTTYPVSFVNISGNELYGSMSRGIYTANGPIIKIAENKISDTGYGVDMANPKTNVTIENNFVVSTAIGVRIDTDATNAPHIKLTDNNVTSTADGVYVKADVIYVSIEALDNHIAAGDDGLLITSGAFALAHFNISGNRILATIGAGDTTLKITGSAQSGVISGNSIVRYDDLAPGLTITCNGAGSITGLSITGNTFVDGTYSIDTDATSSIITGNKYLGYATGTVNNNSIAWATQDGKLIEDVQTVAIPTDGAGTPAAYTLTPTESIVDMTCEDPHGCVITMSETSAVTGQAVLIRFSGSNSASFSESAGVLAMSGAGPFVMVAGDWFRLTYLGSQWNESGRNMETPSTPPSYSFFAHESGATTLGVLATLVYDAEVYDNGTWYDTGTGVATIPVNGVYVFTAVISLNQATMAGGDYYHLQLASSGGGVVYAYGPSHYFHAGGVNEPIGVSVVVYLTAGSTMTVRASTTSAGGADTQATAGTLYHCNFAGALIQ